VGGKLAQKLAEAAAAVAVTPSHGDAQEGIALPWRGLDQFEAVAAKTE